MEVDALSLILRLRLLFLDLRQEVVEANFLTTLLSVVERLGSIHRNGHIIVLRNFVCG